MQERAVLENLILNGEDFLFNGDVIIKGEFNVTNAFIIVSGILELCSEGKIVNGNIMADTLVLKNKLSVIDGDILVSYLKSEYDIISDGNIEVSEDSDVFEVSCLNYLISGNNSSTSITAIQDIYIMGDNESHDMVGRDIFIGGNCNINCHSLVAKSFYCAGSVSFVSSMMVG